LKKLVKKT